MRAQAGRPSPMGRTVSLVPGQGPVRATRDRGVRRALRHAVRGMSAPSLVDVLLDALTDEQAAEFAKRLAPYLPNGAGQPLPLVGPDQAAHRLGIHRKTLVRAAAAARLGGYGNSRAAPGASSSSSSSSSPPVFGNAAPCVMDSPLR